MLKLYIPTFVLGQQRRESGVVIAPAFQHVEQKFCSRDCSAHFEGEIVNGPGARGRMKTSIQGSFRELEDHGRVERKERLDINKQT